MSGEEDIKQRMKDFSEETKAIQDACPHPEEDLIVGSSMGSGNLWKEIYCPRCDKNWRV